MRLQSRRGLCEFCSARHGSVCVVQRAARQFEHRPDDNRDLQRVANQDVVSSNGQNVGTLDSPPVGAAPAKAETDAAGAAFIAVAPDVAYSRASALVW